MHTSTIRTNRSSPSTLNHHEMCTHSLCIRNTPTNLAQSKGCYKSTHLQVLQQLGGQVGPAINPARLVPSHDLQQEASRIITFWTVVLGTLTSRAINWYIDGTILRGLGGEVGGESGNSCEGLQDFTGPRSSKYKYIFGILSSSSVDGHHYWVIWFKWGGGLGHRNAWNVPK